MLARLLGNVIHATRAAVEEGILPGGGVALLRVVSVLNGLATANDDQRVGIEIVRRAIEAPVRQIAENAGAEGSIIVGKLREKEDFAFGWNAQTGEFGDLFQMGVIDPAKVVRAALQDAASVAGLLVTTEAMIAEKPKKDGQPQMPPAPGMRSFPPIRSSPRRPTLRTTSRPRASSRPPTASAPWSSAASGARMAFAQPVCRSP